MGSFDDPETQAHKTETKCQVSPICFHPTDVVPRAERSLLRRRPRRRAFPLPSEVARWFCVDLKPLAGKRVGFCDQVVNRREKPYYEITAGEHPAYVSPEDVAKLIFHKMKGSLWHTHIGMGIVSFSFFDTGA